jgi:hypothetical protein
MSTTAELESVTSFSGRLSGKRRHEVGTRRSEDDVSIIQDIADPVRSPVANVTNPDEHEAAAHKPAGLDAAKIAEIRRVSSMRRQRGNRRDGNVLWSDEESALLLRLYPLVGLGKCA